VLRTVKVKFKMCGIRSLRDDSCDSMSLLDGGRLFQMSGPQCPVWRSGNGVGLGMRGIPVSETYRGIKSDG